MKGQSTGFVIGLVLLVFPWTPQGWTEETAQRFPIVVNDKWGYIDATGEFVLEPQYDEALAFFGDVAMVRAGGKEFCIDKTGTIITDGKVNKGMFWKFLKMSFLKGKSQK